MEWCARKLPRMGLWWMDRVITEDGIERGVKGLEHVDFIYVWRCYILGLGLYVWRFTLFVRYLLGGFPLFGTSHGHFPLA